MGNPEKSAGAASSPHGGPRREEVVTSARRNKQIIPYDPKRAGKEKEMRKNDDRRSVGRGEAGRGNHDQGNAGQGNAANGNAGQRNSAGAGQPQQRNIPRQEQSAGRGMQQRGPQWEQNRYNDGDSEIMNAGYARPDYHVIGSRLGSRDLMPDDARLKLDRLYRSEQIECQGPPGPACFVPRIMKEPLVPNFQLPRGTKTYDGISLS